MGRLEDKVCLIVDGDRRLGQASAEAMAAEGARVVVGRRPRHAGSAADDSTSESRMVETTSQRGVITIDPRDPESSERAIAAVVATHGRLDVLCNTALHAPERRAPLHEMSEAEWDEGFAEGVQAVALPTRFAMRLMKQQRTGSIIIIGSSAALVGMPNIAAFSAAAGVVTNWMRAIALDGVQHGFRANVLSLGSTGEPLVPSQADRPAAAPMPAEAIAPLVVFLASDESRSLNGQVIGADDGLTAWRIG